MNKHPVPIYRLAIVEAHKWICIICRKPITEEFDIDHMIPKEMSDEARKAELETLCARLNRPGFDIWGLFNLGPAHKACNNQKGELIYPDPVLHERLTFIEGKVEDVKRRVAASGKKRAFEKAMLTVMSAISTGEISDEDVNARLASATQSILPPALSYEVVWTPASLELLRAQPVSLEEVEHAIVSSLHSGQMKVLLNPALSHSWIFRFNIGREPWRAYATFDDGLLLVTKVFRKRQAE